MTKLQQNRYDQLLRRVGDLKGPGSKVNDVLTELFPMLDVENIPAELLLLSGSRLCMGTVLQAANVGFFSKAILRNPSESGMIGRLVMITVNAVGTNVVFGPTLNSDVASGASAFADTRVFGEGTALKTQGNNNLLAVGSTFWVDTVDASGRLRWEPPVAISVIAPGSGFEVTANTLNLALRCNFLWIERQAEPSELAL